MEIQHTLVLIDSRDRSLVTDVIDEYTVNLDSAYYGVSSIEMLQAEVPYSWYTINEHNRNFTFSENGATVTNFEVSLDPGNYNITDLMEHITTEMTGESTTGPNLNTYTYSIDPITNIITIDSNNEPFSIRFRTGTQSTLGQIIGFIDSLNAPVVPVPGSNPVIYQEPDPNDPDALANFSFEVTAPFIYNLNPENYLLLKMSPKIDNDIKTSNGKDNDVFAVVPITENSGGFIQFRHNSDYTPVKIFTEPNGKYINQFRIKWTFQDGRRVDFNGVHHMFVLRITHRLSR